MQNHRKGKDSPSISDKLLVRPRSRMLQERLDHLEMENIGGEGTSTGSKCLEEARCKDLL